MKNNGKKYTRSYFAGKLDDYLSARHPAVTGRGRMIKLRSGIAAGLFRQALLTGSDTPRALEAADAALYSGLIFSPFDMV